MFRNIFVVVVVMLLSGCFGAPLVTYPGLQKENSAKVIFEFAKKDVQVGEYGIFGEVSVKKGNACEGRWDELNDNRVQMLMYLPAEETISTKSSITFVVSGAMGMTTTYCNLIATYNFKKGKSYKIKSTMGINDIGSSCFQTVSEVEFVDAVDEKIANGSVSDRADLYIKNNISKEKIVNLQSCK